VWKILLSLEIVVNLTIFLKINRMVDVLEENSFWIDEVKRRLSNK